MRQASTYKENDSKTNDLQYYIGGRASANKNKESKNNEYSTAVNAHNEMVNADDDTDSKEKT